MVHDAAGLFKNLPKLVQVVLFLLLALVAALSGTLDDWVRIVLAILFFGVAVTLFAEAGQALRTHRAGGVEDDPPAPSAPPPYEPPPED